MKTKRIPVPDNWKDLKSHPLATLIGYGLGIDTVKLAEHMRQYGYDDGLEPIVLIEVNNHLEILDGRHRHVAAQEAEVTPSFALFLGNDPVAFTRKKLLRQHLNEQQRAFAAAHLIELSTKLIDDSAAENKGKNNQNVPGIAQPLSQSAAAEQMNVSKASVQRAANVAREGGAQLEKAVTSGQVPLQGAAETTKAVFCVRCQRCGPQKNCSKCQALRTKTALAKYGKKTHKPKPKKIGAEKFDWKGFDSHLGFVMRGPDEIKRAYAVEGNSDEFHECSKLLDQLAALWQRWRRRITRGD